MSRVSNNERRGFSLVELLMVIAIMLVVSAMAMPKFLSAVSDYRLKTTISQVAGMLQQQRMEAVRRNMTLQMSTDTPPTKAWVDVTGGIAYATADPFVQFPKNISIQYSGYPGDASTLLNYTTQTVSASTKIQFNARGLPCVGTGGACSNLDSSVTPKIPVGFTLYFKNDKTFGVSSWGAITITPGGRIRSWFYNGSSYSPM